MWSGSQGKKEARLKNLLFNKKPFVKINDGDAFCFSSKIIPGNEKNVFNIYDEITKKGGVIFNDKHGFHSSGHADQDDLSRVYQSYKPSHAIPIHGSVYFLDKHKTFIEENFKNIKTVNLVNFDRLSISNKGNKTKKEIIPTQDHYQYYFGKKVSTNNDPRIKREKKTGRKRAY